MLQRYWHGLVFLFLLFLSLSSQAAPVFYLVTYGPGPEVWERFGHNALWLYDEAEGEQALYNFGFFDFEQRGFLQNFIRGRMLYYAAATDPAREFPFYERRGRSVQYQRLRLSPEQALWLAQELRQAVQPENREYLYDYFLANCSTRVRDALDQALGGVLRRASTDVILDDSFRRSALTQVQDDFGLYLGIQLGLGRPADRPISRWDSFYLPHHLAAAVAAEGWSDPPVLHSSGQPWATKLEPPWTAMAVLDLVCLCGVLLPAFLLRRRPGLARLGALLWFVIGGLAGLVLAFLWLATDHQAAWRNESLLLLNPLALLVVIGQVRYPSAYWLRVCLWTLLGLLLGALILKLFPGSEFNYDLLLWLTPPQLASIILLMGAKNKAVAR